MLGSGSLKHKEMKILTCRNDTPSGVSLDVAMSERSPAVDLEHRFRSTESSRSTKTREHRWPSICKTGQAPRRRDVRLGRNT